MADGKVPVGKPRTDSVFRDKAGNLYFGGQCFTVKLPKPGTDEPIEVDLSNCPVEVKQALGEAVMKGKPTAYDFRSKETKK